MERQAGGWGPVSKMEEAGTVGEGGGGTGLGQVRVVGIGRVLICKSLLRKQPRLRLRFLFVC